MECTGCGNTEFELKGALYACTRCGGPIKASKSSMNQSRDNTEKLGDDVARIIGRIEKLSKMRMPEAVKKQKIEHLERQLRTLGVEDDYYGYD
jgi:uncharacterized membrane protein YvbJ